MTNPKPGDLGLFVRAEEIPEKCDHYLMDFDGPYSCNDGVFTHDSYGTKWKKGPCPECHGSGTRKVTLEGWVAVRPTWDSDWCDYYLEGTKFRGGEEDIVAHITKALQDGTCPDEIRAQLKVVEDE